MKSYKTQFNSKKITVMGLGLLGRGVGDVAFLAKCGADLIVTDTKTAEQLAPSLEQLKQYPNITYVLGEHRLEDFRDRDMVVKAAGVPLDSPFIAEAEKNNVPVVMSTSLFAKLAPATIVGITGTRGKTTVTMLMYEVLKKAYEGTNTSVYLGGNIRGVATLPFLETIKAGDIAVLELDSWQLQGFGTEHISPQIAVFTTFLEDHLNYYKKDPERYFADKANIFINQTDQDQLILGEQVSEVMPAKFKKLIKAHTTIASAQNVPKQWKLAIPGEHNRYNVGVACAALGAMGIDTDIMCEVVQSFTGVPGRLEKIAEHDGVKVYNDTTATTPDATEVALKAVASEGAKNVILIMGGADKGLEMQKLIDELPTYCKKVFLLPGTGTDRIREEILQHDELIEQVGDIAEATQKAFSIAMSGDVILLSPAFASFGQFKNEYDRGDQFAALVKTATRT